MSEIVPIVIVTNLPQHLGQGGERNALALLGSVTGEEVGVLFWKDHPVLAKFMVAFTGEEARQSWLETSVPLMKVKAEFGVRTYPSWYNRDSDLLLGPTLTLPLDEMSPNDDILESHQYDQKTPIEAQGDSNKVLNVFQGEFEDLGNIFSTSEVEIKRDERKAGEDFSAMLAKTTEESLKVGSWRQAEVEGTVNHYLPSDGGHDREEVSY